jgi:hypothetical protein
LATQIVAAVHQFERHSITIITTTAKDFPDCAPHREPGNQNKLKTHAERAHKTCRKDGIQELMEKGEKNNCFAEDSNEYGKQAPPPVKPPEGGSSRSTTPWPDRWTMSQRPLPL